MVEQFNRSFKNMIAGRITELRNRLQTKTTPVDTTKIQFSDCLPQVSAVYDTKNNYRITGMTPAEAKKPSSEADAKMARELVARKGRRFPILRVGDKARVMGAKKRWETQNG